MRRTAALALVALLSACSKPAPGTPSVHAEARTTPAPAPAHAAPAAPAAPAHGANAAQPARVGADGTRKFGADIAADAQRTRLPEIVQAPAQFTGKTVRLEGNIVAVCQHMGCWMEIRDESTQAHVRMNGHSFFLPRDVNGHRAAVQATVVAAHTPTECDESARQATGRIAAVELDATGVEVYN